MTKLTKAETNYGNGMIHSHCGKVFSNDNGYCKHYNGGGDISKPGLCEIVEGEIKPTAWCDQFDRARK
jgi:hypothetical protein